MGLTSRARLEINILPGNIIAQVTVLGYLQPFLLFLSEETGYFTEYLLGFITPENLLDLATDVSVVLVSWFVVGLICSS